MEQAERFWKIEEISDERHIVSKEDLECENIFKETTTRANDGKFVVTNPLKESSIER